MSWKSVGTLLVVTALCACACSADEGDGATTASSSGAGASAGSGGSAGGSGGDGGSGGSGGDGGGSGGSGSCQLLAAALQDALDTSTAAANRPGGTLAAVDAPPCPLWVGAAGEAESGTPLTATALMRVGSVTKTYTAAAVVALADASVVSLDDTIDTWVSGVPNGDQITVRQTLNHTSGIYNISDDAAFMAQALADPSQSYTPQQIVDAAAAHGASFPPGSSWEYSNTNYTVLGMIIGAATGDSAAAYIRARLLTPQSLDRTFLAGQEPLPEPLAMGYGPGGVDHTYAVHPSLQWTAGSMVASVADVARWARAVYDGDVLSSAARAEMLTFIDTDTANVEYGLGVYRISVAPPTRIGHPGSIFGYHSAMYYLSDDDAVIAVIINSTEGAAAQHFTALYEAVSGQR